MNLGKVEIWETSLDRIVTLREGAKGVLRPPTRQANIMACETKAGVVELWFVNPDWTDGGLSAV